MRKLLEYGGIAASVVLIAVGIGALAMGLNGRSTVRSDLANEQIYGTPDMKGIAGKHVDTGSEAHTFAQTMRKHALAATGGQTYAQMGRFLDKAGKPTNNDKAAAINPNSGQPVDNPARQIWVTEVALSTALNTAYFAENVANFAIAMGVALLLSGIGFLVLTGRTLRRATTRDPRSAHRTSAEPALSS